MTDYLRMFIDESMRGKDRIDSVSTSSIKHSAMSPYLKHIGSLSLDIRDTLEATIQAGEKKHGRDAMKKKAHNILNNIVNGNIKIKATMLQGIIIECPLLITVLGLHQCLLKINDNEMNRILHSVLNEWTDPEEIDLAANIVAKFAGDEQLVQHMHHMIYRGMGKEDASYLLMMLPKRLHSKEIIDSFSNLNNFKVRSSKFVRYIDQYSISDNKLIKLVADDDEVIANICTSRLNIDMATTYYKTYGGTKRSLLYKAHGQDKKGLVASFIRQKEMGPILRNDPSLVTDMEIALSCAGDISKMSGMYSSIPKDRRENVGLIFFKGEGLHSGEYYMKSLISSGGNKFRSELGADMIKLAGAAACACHIENDYQRKVFIKVFGIKEAMKHLSLTRLEKTDGLKEDFGL